MKKHALVLGCLLLGSLSASAEAIEELTAGNTPAATADVTPTEVAAPAGDSITFMDSKLFDGKLSKELESGKQTVEISISGRMPLNNIPSRIDRWLVVSAEEGKVETLPSPPRAKTRALFTVVPMVFSALGFLKSMRDEKLYDTAKQYDTTIYYRKDDNGDSLIDRIVLTKRKPR